MTIYDTLARLIETYGIIDFVIPFVLVFMIMFATLQKIKLFGDPATPGGPGKKFNVIIALIFGLLFIFPHITGTYPPGYDPVDIINEVIPSISLVAVASILTLILLGIFSRGLSAWTLNLVAFVALIFIIYIFGSSLGFWNAPNDIFSWWSEETTELMLVVLVFGLIVWLVTKGPTETDKGLVNWFKKLPEKMLEGKT